MPRVSFLTSEFGELPDATPPSSSTRIPGLWRVALGFPARLSMDELMRT